MNKIIFHIGLLIFVLAVIFFSRLDLPIEDIFIKSFMVFFLLTFMLGIIAIIFMKSISKSTLEKNRDISN